MPIFVGRFDLDSTQIAGRWYRLASYPEGALAGRGRDTFWEWTEQMLPPMVAVFEEVPWETYTTLLVFDERYPGGSALEHGNSHVGIYNTRFIGSPLLASITAHEIFHAWNVKRLRPAELLPYDLERETSPPRGIAPLRLRPTAGDDPSLGQ
jgi:predicted metalloprotease with PDZ domain